MRFRHGYRKQTAQADFEAAKYYWELPSVVPYLLCTECFLHICIGFRGLVMLQSCTTDVAPVLQGCLKDCCCVCEFSNLNEVASPLTVHEVSNHCNVHLCKLLLAALASRQAPERNSVLWFGLTWSTMHLLQANLAAM